MVKVISLYASEAEKNESLEDFIRWAESRKSKVKKKEEISTKHNEIAY